MVVFDTSTIVLTIDPTASPPLDPGTGQPLTRCKDRIDLLLDTLSKAKTPILIPTPVLAEFLVKAGPDKQAFTEKFLAFRNFQVGSFDTKAAIELAILMDPELMGQNRLDEATSKQKVKFDRQIVAIAKVHGASTIYTSDEKLANCARNNGIQAVMTWEIPLPPDEPQGKLFENPDAGTW